MLPLLHRRCRRYRPSASESDAGVYNRISLSTRKERCNEIRFYMWSANFRKYGLLIPYGHHLVFGHYLVTICTGSIHEEVLRNPLILLERETGFEPATPTLARFSTNLLPLQSDVYKVHFYQLSYSHSLIYRCHFQANESKVNACNCC